MKKKIHKIVSETPAWGVRFGAGSSVIWEIFRKKSSAKEVANFGYPRGKLVKVIVVEVK